MNEVKENEQILDSNDNSIEMKGNSNFSRNYVDEGENLKPIIIKNVILTPKCTHKLLSMKNLIQDGYEVNSEREIIFMRKGNILLKFYIKIQTNSSSFLIDTRLIPNPLEDKNIKHVTLLKRY